MKIKYLFPFDEVTKGSKIVIYGGGEVGRQYLSQLSCLNYCDCLFVVDRNHEELERISNVEVYSPERLKKDEYDKIIIATTNYNDEIYEILYSLNIPDEKIVKKVITVASIQDVYMQKRKRNTIHPQNSEYWGNYYNSAEIAAEGQFNRFLQPVLSKYKDIDFNEVLDFACGHGRIANLFSKISGRITCCDVNADAIEFCKNRFHSKTDCSFRFTVNKTENNSLIYLPFTDNEFSFIYSWDAMVHFSYKWLDFYIKEFYRIICNNSYVVFHHSNFAGTDKYINCDGGEDWLDNPGWRGAVSSGDVKFIAENHGFAVVEQQIFDWSAPELDCITILKK